MLLGKASKNGEEKQQESQEDGGEDVGPSGGSGLPQERVPQLQRKRLWPGGGQLALGERVTKLSRRRDDDARVPVLAGSVIPNGRRGNVPMFLGMCRRLRGRM